MAQLTWGDLLKSQADNETIEEAIARIIQEHDDDETAHLDEGQSLLSHKAADVIDHLARSVYRDKLAFDRFQIDEHFSTIDSWNVSAGVTLDAVSQMSLITTNVTNNRRSASISPGDGAENAGAAANSPTWIVRVKIGQATNQIVYIGQTDPDIPAGFGFKIVNGTLYAFYIDSNDAEQTIEISGVTVTNWHNYRCEYVAGSTLKWYVDDVLKYTLSSGLPANFGIFMWFSIQTTTTATKIMYVQSVHYDEDYSD